MGLFGRKNAHGHSAFSVALGNVWHKTVEDVKKAAPHLVQAAVTFVAGPGAGAAAGRMLSGVLQENGDIHHDDGTVTPAAHVEAIADPATVTPSVAAPTDTNAKHVIVNEKPEDWLMHKNEKFTDYCKRLWANHKAAVITAGAVTVTAITMCFKAPRKWISKLFR